MKNNKVILWTSFCVLLIITFISIARCSTVPFRHQRLIAWIYGAEFIDVVGVILQSKNNNCGPTALKMIFDRYGIEISLEEIEQKVQLHTNGSSMLSLKSVAQAKGLKTEGWRLSLIDLMNVTFPILLFIHQNHFVVADSIDKNDDLYLRDPSLGRLKIAKERLPNIWTGETLLFRYQNDTRQGLQ